MGYLMVLFQVRTVYNFELRNVNHNLEWLCMEIVLLWCT